MMTGVHPFGRPAGASALNAGRITAIRSALLDAPPALTVFFEHALAAEPHRRPASAEIFFRGLEKALTA
jgi:hypothetical protein